MEVIEAFLQEFGSVIFEEHLELLCAFKREYTDCNVYSMPCSHESTSGDVVGLCGCYFFFKRKKEVMRIIENYKKILKHFKCLNLCARKTK